MFHLEKIEKKKATAAENVFKQMYVTSTLILLFLFKMLQGIIDSLTFFDVPLNSHNL